MDELLKVSILIPIFNAEKYIERCLDSIFSQTYSSIDFVFVDNCSSDNSIDILKRKINQYHIQEDRVKLIIHERNEGIAVSRNDCLKNATGDYVLFVDSDDWIEPNMVELLVASVNKDHADIVGCDFIMENNGEQKYCKEPYCNNGYDNMIKAIDYELSSVLWKLLIKRNLFHSIHFTPNLDIVEDYIVTIKLYQHAEIVSAVHQGLYHYILRQGSASSVRWKSLKSHVKGVEIIEKYFIEKNLYDDNIRHRLMLRKFNIKSNFLTKQFLDYEAYRKTFPESNYIWREMNYSKNEKIKFWMAEKGLFTFLKIIQRCLK